jgi:hypothetical protein
MRSYHEQNYSQRGDQEAIDVMVKPQSARFHSTDGYGWENVDDYGWNHHPEEGVIGDVWRVELPHAGKYLYNVCHAEEGVEGYG